MKSYAFVRTNIPRALACNFNFEKENNQSDNEEITSDSPFVPPCPDFSNYLFFLFAPTLVYKDNYPRYGYLYAENLKFIRFI